MAWLNGSDFRVPDDAIFEETMDSRKVAISKMGS